MKQRNDLAFYDQSAPHWWDKNAKVYALHHLNAPRFEYFDRSIPNWCGLSVLDVGCGGGFTCEFLAQRGAIATGIDQSAQCIAAAQQHATAAQLSISYQAAHGELLPFADAVFDVVVCVDVLEHVVDWQQTLREIHRVLKLGGIFCFDTINRTFKSRLIMIWLLENLLHEIPRGIHDWHKFIQPMELENSLSELGFQAIEMKGFNIFGEILIENITAYQHYRKTGQFNITINNDQSVMYIGKAVRL